MVRYGLPSMEVQSYVDHRIARPTPRQPEPYYATMPSCWANAREGRAVWPRVGLVATPPHPYKPLGLLIGPYPTVKKPFVSLSRVGAK